MQSVEAVLFGACVACLAITASAVFLMERRWQHGVERDAQAVMAHGRYKDKVRDDSLSPLQWQARRLCRERMPGVSE